jgi:hypothetical protein
VWTLVTTLPFLTLSPTMFQDPVQAGPSRYLYLPSLETHAL